MNREAKRLSPVWTVWARLQLMKKYELHEGESIVMPAKHPHAVFGKEQFKMLLVVVF